MKLLRRFAPWTTALVAAWVVLTCVTAARAAGALPLPGDYAVDKAGSSVAFTINHLLVASTDGKFNAFSGKVTVGDSLATSHVEATVDVKSIDTGSGMRDDHLRSADFFDVARFPP